MKRTRKLWWTNKMACVLENDFCDCNKRCRKWVWTLSDLCLGCIIITSTTRHVVNILDTDSVPVNEIYVNVHQLKPFFSVTRDYIYTMVVKLIWLDWPLVNASGLLARESFNSQTIKCDICPLHQNMGFGFRFFRVNTVSVMLHKALLNIQKLI